MGERQHSTAAPRAIAAIAICAAALALAAPAGAAETHVVKVDNYKFEPATVTIAPGDTVSWQWVNGAHSTTRSGSDGWDSGVRPTPFTYERTFSSAGSFAYLCTPHAPGMSGSVVVKAPNQLPTASFMATPAQPLPGEAVSFDGSASSDPDGSVKAWHWDLDGIAGYETVTSTPTTTYAYDSAGTKTVRLYVVDNAGGQSTPAVRELTVSSGTSDPGSGDPGTGDPGTQEPPTGGDAPTGGGGEGDAEPDTMPGDGPLTESDQFFEPDTTAPAASGSALRGQRLGQALKRGLRTRWNFTEPVDGVLRVLIKRRVARRLGLKGASRRVLVARAALSTSKPGAVAVKVSFKKRVARKLRRARALDLRLDLRVADAAGNEQRLIRSARLRR